MIRNSRANDHYYAEVSLQEFVDAIEKNGLPKTVAGYYAYNEDNEIVAGCAFGQAARNLDLSAGLLDIAVTSKSPNLRKLVIHLNDTTDLSLPEIAYAVKQRYSPAFLKRKVYVRNNK